MRGLLLCLPDSATDGIIFLVFPPDQFPLSTADLKDETSQGGVKWNIWNPAFGRSGSFT